MITMIIILSNRREYRMMNSAWAACMVGCAMMNENSAIETIFVTDAETGEVYKQIVRG